MGAAQEAVLGAGFQKRSTRDERFAALDSLDEKTRARVDAFARSAIVESHPEWLQQALAEAPTMKVPVGLHEKGGNSLFAGLKDGKGLIQLLDAAPLAAEGVTSLKPAAKDAADKLSNYTADKIVYYRIAVIERSSQPEVLTFAEADQEGVLSQLLDKQLEAYYLKIREDDPKAFQKEDKSWKSFADAKDAVAERYFDKLLKKQPLNLRSGHRTGNSS